MPSTSKHSAGLNLPASGFFITGTNTDVGKTYATACIAFSLRQQGQKTTPRKPIASGCIKDSEGHLRVPDAEVLKAASQTEDSINTICPYQFIPAISPQTAIQQAGKVISTAQLIKGCQFNRDEFYLVEGAGGFYSPLSSDGLNKDLAVQLNLPVILVVKNRLGCINQALLTIEAIQNNGLKIHAIIVNFANQQDFASDLKLWTKIPIWPLNFQADQAPQLLPELAL